MGMITAIRALPRGELLRLCAAGILLAGLCCAALVYATADDGPGAETEQGSGQGAGYVTEGGESFAVLPTDSRSYQRSLEYYGGKSALVMLELRQWFAGLWHGSSLALVIACAAVLAAGGCLYVAGAEYPGGADDIGGPGKPGGEPGDRSSRTRP